MIIVRQVNKPDKWKDGAIEWRDIPGDVDDREI